MSSPVPAAALAFEPATAARRLVAARRAARALPAFPGPPPADLAEGYACQDAAMALWPDEVGGWKVGRIPPELQAALGAERIAGPIFRRNIWTATETATALPMIRGGFAAVEAEYIYRLGRDAPAGKTRWSPEEALELVEEQRVGVEFAASPLAGINDLGPQVVAADFGNNSGLIIGRAIPDWRARTDDWPSCEVRIDGELVGSGAPSSLPGGPVAALVFLLGALAARGRPARRGQLITTGATTGVHEIQDGQTARVSFAELDEIRCITESARPAEDLEG